MKRKLRLGRGKINRVEISVSDNEGNEEEEIRTHILKPFFTTKKVGKGTGLGLSISKGIAETHKGNLYLDLDSENTTFVLTIPIVQNQFKQAA